MNTKSSGFTLVELMVVVAIIIVLASVAIGSTSSVLKNLRFSNNFNQMVFMVQEARDLALNGKDKNSQSYSVQFDMPVNTSKITVKQTNKDNSTTDIETYILTPGNNLQFFSTPSCMNTVVIQFLNTTGKTQLFCDTNAVPAITVGLKESTQNGRTKNFSIHQVAGIPQVN